jgi:hypothetical protein
MAYTLKDSYTTDNSAFTFSNVNWVCQTFVAGSSYDCSMVELPLSRVTGYTIGTITLGIRAVDGSHKPTGGDLGYGTYAGDTLGTDDDEEYVQFVLNTTVPVVNGTEYALVCRAPECTSTGRVRWSEDSAGGGTGIETASTDSGATWSSDLGDTLDFKTYSGSNVVYEDMAATGGFTGGGECTIYVGDYVDMANTGGFTGGGTCTMLSHVSFTGSHIPQRLAAVGNDRLYYEDI